MHRKHTQSNLVPEIQSDTEREGHRNTGHCLFRFTFSRQQRAPPEHVLSIHRQGLEIQHARKQ
ncbi:hypothetical protein TNCV_2893171, partial [Trichonephila clavipes]